MVSVPGPTSDAHVLHLVRCQLLLLGGPADALALDVAVGGHQVVGPGGGAHTNP